MNPPNNTQKKWIATAVVVLFILSGGIYQLRRQARTGEQTGTQQETPSPQAATATEGETTASSGDATRQEHGATNDEGKPDAGVTTAGTAATPETTETTETTETKAEKPANGGFFAGLFSGKKPAPSGSTGTAAVGGAIGGAGALASKTGGVAAPSAPSLPAAGAGSGTADIGSAAPSAGTQTQTAMAPAVPQDSCFTVAYHHKPSASHPDEETCSHHKNWLKLKHPNVNSKSVCVRVNGTPVHYLAVKGKPDEVVFGSVAGPKAKVTVRYCTGKATDCGGAKEDCTVPKDEFMEAIGGSDGSKGDARLGQWDPKSPSDRESDVMAKLDGAVKRELETNDELNGRAPNKDMYKDWISDNESSACGTQQARND